MTSALSWTAEGKLQTVTTGAAVNRYRYDAEGQRVVQITPTATVIYLDRYLEIRKPTTGAMTAKRYYFAGGGLLAVAGNSLGMFWQVADVQGTTSLNIPNAPSTSGITRQRYRPFGVKRGDSITTTDNGFLGLPEDPTGLDYLNARYLDPVLGRFISVDPLISVTRDAYGYGNNNPIAYSDPSGLCAPDNGGDRQRCIDESESVYNDDGAPLGTIRGPSFSPGSRGSGFAKSVQNSLYDIAADYVGVGQFGVTSQLDQAQLIAFVFLQRAKDVGWARVGPNGRLQGPTSDTRYLSFVASFGAKSVLGIWAFAHAKGAGPFDGCDAGCAAGTAVMGLAAFSMAGGACVWSAGFACTVSVFAAGGMTSLTYEALSNPAAKGGQLACAFFFGPSNPAANAMSYVYGAGSTALIEGGSKVAAGVVQDIVGDIGGSAIGC